MRLGDRFVTAVVVVAAAAAAAIESRPSSRLPRRRGGRLFCPKAAKAFKISSGFCTVLI